MVARPVMADIINVPADQPTIQAGIDAAVDGDEVVVADDMYTGPGNKNLDFQDKAITLRSKSGNRDGCIIDCENDGRFASFGAGDTAVVQSITVMRGSAGGGSGGAVFLFSGSPSFIDCVFEGCNAGTNGGALYVLNGTATVEGCLFAVNTAGSRGGAIYASGSSVALVDDTELDDNQSAEGGGVYISGGDITVSGCNFTRNSTTSGGGGLRVVDNAILTCTDSSFTANLAGVGGNAGGGGMLVNLVNPTSEISGCQFTDNEATGSGGGLALTQNFPEISDCIFQGNFAPESGGVLFRNSNTTRVENVLFLDNTANFGGGTIVESNASPEFVNCLFAGNSAIAGGGFLPIGGAIVIAGGTPTMVNCTLSGNSSEEFGGAVGVAGGGALGLANCVLWDNQAPTGPEIRIGYLKFGSGTVTVSYSDVAGGVAGVSNDGGTLNWGAGNIDRDPLFVDPDGPDNDPDTYEDNDYRLGASSQAIDAADNTAVPVDITIDLDSNPRYIEDPNTPDTGLGDCLIVDMGSYEFQEGTTDCIVGPVDFTAFRGFLASGTLDDVLESDDNYLCHEPGIVLNPAEAPITLYFFGIMPNDSPSTLDVTIESSANTVGLELTFSFWNYNTNSWDIVGTATQSLNADTVRTFAGDPVVHVEPGTGEVRTRYEVRVVSFIFVFPWLDCVDHVFWTTG